jgi:hypothetical protein
LSGLAWDRWRLVWAILCVEQGSRPARRNKKEPCRFCPLSARCSAWPSKETAFGLRSGSLASNSETVNRYCSSSVCLSRTIETIFVPKSAERAPSNLLLLTLTKNPQAFEGRGLSPGFAPPPTSVAAARGNLARRQGAPKKSRAQTPCGFCALFQLCRKVFKASRLNLA